MQNFVLGHGLISVFLCGFLPMWVMYSILGPEVCPEALIGRQIFEANTDVQNLLNGGILV